MLILIIHRWKAERKREIRVVPTDSFHSLTMSFLRILAANKGSSSTKHASSSSSGSASQKMAFAPILALHIPSYGAIMMNPPGDPLNPQNPLDRDGPRNDQILHGELEISLSRGCGRKRYKTIRVGLRTITELDVGVGRMGEEDIIFERKVEEIAGDLEARWLDESTQRYGKSESTSHQLGGRSIGRRKDETRELGETNWTILCEAGKHSEGSTANRID